MFWHFRPNFVNCCPSNLLSDSILPTYTPLSCVKLYTVYTYRVQCVSLGLLPAAKCLYRSIFRWRHFALTSMSLWVYEYIFPRKSSYNWLTSWNALGFLLRVSNSNLSVDISHSKRPATSSFGMLHRFVFIQYRIYELDLLHNVC